VERAGDLDLDAEEARILRQPDVVPTGLAIIPLTAARAIFSVSHPRVAEGLYAVPPPDRVRGRRRGCRRSDAAAPADRTACSDRHHVKLSAPMRAPTDDNVAILRRSTSSILAWAAIACAVVTFALGSLALWVRPETRPLTLFGWFALGAIVQSLSRERSRQSALFAVVLPLPIVSAASAAYEVHVRWGVPTASSLVAAALVLALYGTLFVRALVASGSADYPYDD
jgi:hypothetical protein